MTTKKAVQIVEMLLEKKTSLKRDLAKSENDWGNDIVGSFIQTELTSLTNEIAWLQILKKEIAPDCKHPKEDIDLDPSTKKPYCVACNWGL